MALPLAAIGLGVTAASSLASIGTGIFNSVQQNKANKANNELQQQTFDLQREQQAINQRNNERDFEYNKQLQEKIFQREDTAVQRMVADNRAAGLSPIAGLAGAGTGQALEANTPQLNQSFDTPQMSASSINADFNSLSNLGTQLTNYEQYRNNYQLQKSQLELNQQKLGLEKSQNEENLKLMKEQIESTKIRNQVARATIEDDIAGKKLSNQRAEKEIARIGVDILDKVASVNGKNILNLRSQYELDELKANRDLRDRLGEKQYENLCNIVDSNKMSIEQKTASIAIMMATEERAQNMYGTQLNTLVEQYRQLVESGQKNYGLKRSLESIGMDSQSASNWQYFYDKLTGLLGGR